MKKNLSKAERKARDTKWGVALLLGPIGVVVLCTMLGVLIGLLKLWFNINGASILFALLFITQGFFSMIQILAFIAVPFGIGFGIYFLVRK